MIWGLEWFVTERESKNLMNSIQSSFIAGKDVEGMATE